MKNYKVKKRKQDIKFDLSKLSFEEIVKLMGSNNSYPPFSSKLALAEYLIESGSIKHDPNDEGSEDIGPGTLEPL